MTGPAATGPAASGPAADTLTIDPRFCGPPGTGNGGYVAGLLAARLGGAGEITLRLPPPVGTRLTVTGAGAGLVTLLNGSSVLASGTAGRPELELPEPVSVARARETGARSRLRTHPEEHPYPGCFVCGPDRGDGLGIVVGPVPGRPLAADVWWPDGSLAGPGGEVAAEFVWAALDCPGGVGAIGADFSGGAPWVLGRVAACLLAPVRAGEPHVTVGWRIAHEGRRLIAGSAVFTPSGDVAGYARATWVQLRS